MIKKLKICWQNINKKKHSILDKCIHIVIIELF